MADVEIYWTLLRSTRNSLWHDAFCLYAYVHPEANAILYIGKADFHTVRQRMRGPHKKQVFDDLKQIHGVDRILVMHGAVRLPVGQRKSSALLHDLESLLIIRLKPSGNIMSIGSRDHWRQGLHVVCRGDWPHARKGFRDV